MIENDSMATAIGHLEMIVQAAKGEYSPRKGELEKRQAAVLAFIRTGQCVASDEDRTLLSVINSAIYRYERDKDGLVAAGCTVA